MRECVRGVIGGRRAVAALCCVAAVALISGCAPDAATRSVTPGVVVAAGGRDCRSGPVPPPDYYARATVSGLAVLRNRWVASLSAVSPTLGVFAGNRVPGTQPEGFPVNTGVDPSAVTAQMFLRTWAYMADDVAYPRPTGLLYEGSPGLPLYDGDQLTVTTDCRTYELIGLNDVLHRFVGGGLPGPWQAEGAVVWDADYTPRTKQYTPQGITAAGVPLTPLVLRWEEVQAALGGNPIGHAFHWFGATVCNGAAVVWPARRTDCNAKPDATAPPMGAWFRLRADYPTAGLSPQARVVVDALKAHGMILGDGGGQGLAFGTAPCPKGGDDISLCWSGRSLAELRSIPLSAFEAVDATSLRKSPTAGTSDPDYWLVR